MAVKKTPTTKTRKPRAKKAAVVNETVVAPAGTDPVVDSVTVADEPHKLNWKWIVGGVAAMLLVLAVFVGYNKTKVTPTLNLPQKIVEQIPDKPKVAVEAISKLRSVKKYYLLIGRADGKIELRTGGTASWRYNNPGNILYGEFAKANGAIGAGDDNVAIFPTVEVGTAALQKMLFVDEGYKTLGLTAAMEKFAPKKDGYDPSKYVTAIVKKLNVDKNIKLDALSEEQRNGVIATIRELDKPVEGKVKVFDTEEDFQKNGW
jgi:hypothetical protein